MPVPCVDRVRRSQVEFDLSSSLEWLIHASKIIAADRPQALSLRELGRPCQRVPLSACEQAFSHGVATLAVDQNFKHARAAAVLDCGLDAMQRPTP